MVHHCTLNLNRSLAKHGLNYRVSPIVSVEISSAHALRLISVKYIRDGIKISILLYYYYLHASHAGNAGIVFSDACLVCQWCH